MTPPPLLIGAALMFWGWQTGLLALAGIAALLIEGARLVKLRWNLTSRDFNRISDLCTLIVLATAVYGYIANGSAHAVRVILQWLPLSVLPLVMAQVYSTADKVPLADLFLLFRKKKGAQKRAQRAVNLLYPYFSLVILCASAANLRTPWFYGGVLFLAAWALWSARPKRFSMLVWILLFLAAGGMGYLGHVGLHNLQRALEKGALGWFSGRHGKDFDPYRARTAMGDVATLKGSDRIQFRVDPGSRPPRPLLLRVAVYDRYRAPAWLARRPGFSQVRPEKDRTTWKLSPFSRKGQWITVLEHLSEGRGMLKLPKGAFQISRLPVVLMKQNRFGAVRVEGGPGFAAYGIGFHRANSLSGAPTQTDLTVPHKERPAVLRVAKNLGLQGSSPEEFLKKLTVFFRKEFRYSLGPNPVGNRETHLADFLLNTRSGHCECFATATVLLLRAAGIPARYAVGYSVHEWSELEQRFVVRARHAHAWALAYVKGAWQDVDTTPPDWTRMEEEAASPMQRLYDAWSWVMLKVSQWRWQGEKGSMTRYLPWLLAPLILVLTWRVLRKKPIRRLGGKREEPALGPETSGADSEFYGIERKLNQWGYARPPWETLSGWIHGLKQDPVLAPTLESLDPVLALHYRYRFHPNGITEQERQELTAAVQVWLAERETRQESH